MLEESQKPAAEETETDAEGAESNVNVGFRQVCEAVSVQYNIDLIEVVKTMKGVYATVIEMRKRHGKECSINKIKCGLKFRKTEETGNEDVVLVFGARQLVILDVVPFRRVNPVSGERSVTAMLRVCPGSFGRFNDKFPKPVAEKAREIKEAVAEVMPEEETTDVIPEGIADEVTPVEDEASADAVD